ncbi:fumarate hydratase [Betaproteobacteria bacterium]|nr:fumarate hydratase [Betaproteobacteria bacterium]
MIRAQDIVESISDAFQFISYYHPKDFIDAVFNAYRKEQSVAAKDALAQILTNSKLCAIGKRPICQDTGIATIFVKIGHECKFDFNNESLTDLLNEGVRLAYTDKNNPLRASVLADPASHRRNTKDNTPAVIHFEFSSGADLDIICAAKGGGSEAKSKLFMLNPSDSVADTIINAIPGMGAGWCPPGILGIGIGGTPEKALLLAKKSLMGSIDIQHLIEIGPKNKIEELRLEIYHRANQLGIGAQGLGGLTTVLDVKILEYPTHAANLPVGLIPNCAATRHIHFKLNGSGPAKLTPPVLSDYPNVNWQPDEGSAIKVNLDNLTKNDLSKWKMGERLLLTGHLLTGRDAAHKRLCDMLKKKEKLPVNLKNRVIYYVGPVDAVRSEVVGPAGPTTATRMDKFTSMILKETGLLAMIGKAERGQDAILAIKENQSAYLMGVGGAAYLVSKAIKKSRVVAFEELGMEAIYEFFVEDMPVTVAVDSAGNSIHNCGPREWKIKISELS